MGRLPHAWIAPPETRELRELVRHRAKLVAMRSRCKAEVHAVLAKGGIWVPMTDLFGIEGNLLLDKVRMPAPYMARIASLRRFVEAFDAEIDLFTGLAQRRLTHDAGYTAIQQIPGIGPVLAAVFVCLKIGDVHRFDGTNIVVRYRYEDSDLPAPIPRPRPKPAGRRPPARRPAQALRRQRLGRPCRVRR